MSKYCNLLLLLPMLFSESIFADKYVVPPTSRSSAHVPVISDAAMENCVKLFNEAKWLAQKLDTINVDRYSQASVDNYNKQILKHREMTNQFNNKCAGKQSRSAYEAAKKLNATR